jgi:exonuclease SbcC
LNQWKFEFGSAFERHLELERVADDLRRVQSIRVRQQTISEGEHPDLQKEQSLLEGLKMELKEGMLKACARIEPELESSLQFEDGAELVKRLAEFLETATRVETEMSSVRKNILRIEGKLTIDFPELPVEGDLEAWWSETSTSHDSAKLRLEQESDPLSTAEELDREVIDGALAAWEQAEQSLTETLDNLSQLRIDDESWKDEERLLSEAESSASSILQLRKLEAIAAEQAWGLKQIRASLEEHRAALMPGEACPLCGALEHPFSVDVPEIPVEQVGVEQARKAATDAANAHQKIREDRQKLQSKLEHAENRIRELEAKRDELLLSLEKARTDLPSAFMGIEGLSEVQRIWKSHLDLEKAKLGWHTTHLRLQAIRNELDELLKLEREMKNHSADLERHAPEGLQAFKQKVKGWSDSWASIERDESVCQSKVQSLALESLNLEQEMAQLHAELFPEIVACGHDSLASACSCLLPSAEFGRLRATRKELDDICNQAIARWEEAQRQWHELAVPAESLAELEFRQAQISEELEPLRTSATKVLAAIEKEKDRQESIVKLKADRAEKLRGGEKWHLLAREIGSATGDKFNRFAQQLTLEHLIHLANIRLQRLTQRYRLHLAPESEQLAVLDADLAGVPRSVKTLSGGETFLISLGLALALSDLASKNVRIHNLFIDEGFGTLDPETLETTLTVLDLLQADDERSIGVISHVEALKERIAAQVQLIPDGRGNSRIQVQG